MKRLLEEAIGARRGLRRQSRRETIGAFALKFLIALLGMVVLSPGLLAQHPALAVDAVRNLPLLFEPNRGQQAPEVLFLTRAAGGAVALRRDGFTLQPSAGEAVDLTFSGKAATVSPSGEQEASTRVNYLSRAASLRNLPTYRQVHYPELYPGIGLVAYGHGQQFEFDLVLKPGADLNRFGMDLSAEGASLDESGDLRLGHSLVLRAPAAYQQGEDGRRHAVQVRYVLRAKHVSLLADAYDPTRPLTIDPQLVMTYGTYLSGSSGSNIYGIATDSSGDTYVVGTDFSTDFPTQNPLETTGALFVSKLNPAGTALIYSTFIAGTSAQPGAPNSAQPALGHSLAVDSSGNAYIVGKIGANDTFPLTANAYPLTVTETGYEQVGFLLKLSADGSQIPYASYTYNAGFGQYPLSLAVDNSGKAYLSGSAQYAQVPVAASGYMPTVPSYEVQAAFFEKFDTTLSGAASLPYATYFGANGVAGSDIGCDNSGHAFLMGSTLLVSTGHGGLAAGTIPTRNAIQSTAPGNADTFLAEFDTTVTGDASLLASTYIGGSGNDYGSSLALDSSNNVYITGYTTSGDFLANPSSNGAPVQSFLLSSQDGYAVKIAATSSSFTLVYSTYLGNTATTTPTGIAALATGQAVVTGYATAGLTTLSGLTVASPAGSNLDNFVAELSTTGGSYVYSSYLGNTGGSQNSAFVAVEENFAVLAGTWVDTGAFPVTPGAIQPAAPAAGTGGFIAKYVFQQGSSPYISNVTPNAGSNAGAVTFTINGGNFESGATVTLHASSGALAAQTVQVSTDGAAITGNFDLRGVSAGAFDLTVTNPDATTVTLTQGFTVQSSSTDGTFTQVIGPSAQRIGGGMVYTILYGNSGNTDQYYLPLFITFNDTFSYKILTPLLSPNDANFGGHIDLSATTPDYDDGNGHNVLELVLPFVPANSTSAIQLMLIAPASQSYILSGYEIDSQMFPAIFTVGPAGTTNYGIGMLSGVAGLPQVAALTGAPRIFARAGNSPGYLRDLVLTDSGRRLFDVLDGIAAHPAPDPLAIFDQAGGSSGQPTWVQNLAYTQAGKRCISRVLQAGISALTDIPGFVPGVNCVLPYTLGQFGNAANAAIAQSLEGTPPPQPIAQVGEVAVDGAGCIPIVGEYVTLGKTLKNVLYLTYYSLDCAVVAQTGGDIFSNLIGAGGKHGSLLGQFFGAFDPNLKSGPAGYGAADWIGPAQPLNYSVEFQNTPTATAPAQNVLIVDVLDRNTIDLTSVRFGSVVLGTHIYTPPANSISISATMDLRPDVNVLVGVQASLDTAGSDLVWQFTSLDPATGQPLPSGSILGFLPPDSPAPIGEANLSFTARLKSNVATGTVLNNGAAVNFDTNPTIYTPTWTNTIDVDPPVSRVAPLPATEASANFAVSWSGADVGSGIVAYSIYVAQNGGAFAPWLSNTTLTSATYQGTPGNTYSFFSIAQDGAGNSEPLKSAAEASTAVASSGAPAVSLSSTSLVFAAQTLNIAGSAQTVTLTNSGSATLAIAGIQITGATASEFHATSTCGAALGAGLSCTVPVTFTPSSAGAAASSLIVTDNAGDSPQIVALSGVANTGTTATTTTLSASAATLALHQGVTFSAAIAPSTSGAPTGAVSFYNGNILLGLSAPANGVANLPVSTLPSGTNTITAAYSGDATYSASASNAVSIAVSPQDIWVVNSNATVSVLDNAGSPANSGLSGGGAGVAIDNSGDVWSAQPSANSLIEFSNTGNVLGAYTGGGLNAPAALAVSGTGFIWVANGNGTLSAFTNTGVAASPAAGLSGGGLSAPSSIAIDSSGNVWVANSGNNSVTQFLGAADPVVTPIAAGAATGALGSRP